MESLEGKMDETPGSVVEISTKLQRIAKLAHDAPELAFTTLAHHLDLAWMREAYRRTRKDGATGVDGQTAEQYAERLDENLLSLLERRLDNVVHRLGFSGSRAQARQLVRHGHVRVNGKKVNVPSYVVGTGAVVSVKEKSKANPLIAGAVETAKGRGIPAWLELNAAEFQGKVVTLPKREDVALQVNEKLIVELYSK